MGDPGAVGAAKARLETGQIIATSHDLGPQKVAFWKGNPLISAKSRLVKYYNLARLVGPSSFFVQFGRCMPGGSSQYDELVEAL